MTGEVLRGAVDNDSRPVLQRTEQGRREECVVHHQIDPSLPGHLAKGSDVSHAHPWVREALGEDRARLRGDRRRDGIEVRDID